LVSGIAATRRLSGIDRLRAVSASRAVVNASVCEAVKVNCGIFTLGPKARGWRILAAM
jgi:hypothetical protein